MTRDRLPIDDVLPQLIEHLSAKGAVVLKAEPGAGKTTRVPPAVLDAGLAQLANNTPGQILVLQPRRVAARSAAARMSQESGTKLGAEIGYQVRHEVCASRDTRILVCTEGIFLRRIQDDPFIENIAVVIFDEFHERSVDSDLALAMLRVVRKEVRPDLRVVVMSATMDCEPIAHYLGDCASVESSGRCHPIDLEYQTFPSNAPIEQLAAEGAQKMLLNTPGHVLVFLPGLGEIRQTQAILDSSSQIQQEVDIMPLYGDLPLQDQQRVLQPSAKKKLVLATNVAETSITIDGVTAVVDSGYARIMRFDSRFGLNQLELARISKASAAQRAGRAGRTSPGKCLRLWTEKEHFMLPDFDLPEILRVDLSEAILQLIAWGETDLQAFPWFEAPPVEAIERALRLLHALDAIDVDGLTDLGRSMVRYPLHPRLARLLTSILSPGAAKRAALCAAFLSERPPFRRSDTRYKPEHSSDSDVLDRLSAIEAFANDGIRESAVGQISPGVAKQIVRTGEQLYKTFLKNGEQRDNQPANRGTNAGTGFGDNANVGDESLLRGLVLAFPDRVCKRRESKERRGLMVGGKGVKLADESAIHDARLFLAVELGAQKQGEILVRQASRVELEWLPQSQLSNSIDVFFDRDRERVMAMRRVRFADLVIEESPTNVPSDVDPGAVLAEAVTANFDVNSLVDDSAKEYLARVLCLREWLPDLNLPDFGKDPWRDLLPDWCFGLTSVAELRASSPAAVIQARLTYQQTTEVEEHAPQSFALPSGRHAKIQYQLGQPPILAARIQDLFGVTETPRLARSTVPVLVHLLAPNYRVQQITADLGGFWKNTYAQVKKDLKGRYPKHAWPDDPTKPLPPRGSAK